MKSVKKFIKKYRFVVNLILICIIILMIILLIKTPQKITNWYKNDPSVIEKVEITNGNNGEIQEITEYEQITKITEYLGQIKIKKNIYTKSATGWTYRFKITQKNSKEPLEIVFAGSHSKINNKYYTFSGPDIKTLVDELNGQ